MYSWILPIVRLVWDSLCTFNCWEPYFQVKLDIFGFNVKIGSGSFSLYKNSGFIGSSCLIDGSYRLKLDNILLNLYLLCTGVLNLSVLQVKIYVA